MSWDPSHYLQFADDRSRPFLDLVARIQGEPRSIVDLGCGPGQLTAVLRTRWPEATIHGVDSSPEMIERANADNQDGAASYEVADVATWAPGGEVDAIVSNALFQWVPDQLAVIERLSSSVAPGGTFALQVPFNYTGPSHTLLHEISSRGPYASHTEDLHGDRGTPPEAYLELFSNLGWQVDVWETTYLHVLHGEDAVFDWISSTGARPIIQALPEGLREEFVDQYKAALREAYPHTAHGTVFPFARVFAVARQAT
ncbi:trans-aconitate 2-methyltransferase [Aeromicrobium panaciterrae]|uniref:Trans-aconitate 2-methyltransferase n=1 Tax=Aeromicrobium panaciterrae TaxID=363861 RepID=A0ABU1ULQ2_9ACTN|nr:methyltransferase domain-containing protein [Aeromicrobium panaciterrae]MDR7086095.1 trans-aconitate 2-methyltransferase [Aeromicrobium panaciterrae]